MHVLCRALDDSVRREGPGVGTDDLDPVLAHLLRKARAETVRREFRATPAASYTERHDVTLLVGLHLTFMRRLDGN